MDIKVVVASHKPYEMPQDKMYIPLQVGAEGKEPIGFACDNTGDNISFKNPGFCELTGMYWAWKNLDADYVGLVHYRRHFGKKGKILDFETAKNLLQNTGVILPKKRNYYIETLYSHYANTMHIEPLDIALDIIKEKYPEYSKQTELLNKRRSAHMFNMLIMKKELFDDYCEFLFDVLFTLENRAKNLCYDEFHSRFYGRISELLLDVWLNTKNIKSTEYPVLYLEKINMPKKILSFLAAKFFGKKYRKSF